MATFYTGATGVGSGPHLDFRVYDVSAGDFINPTNFTDMLTVGGKPLTDQYRMTSGYGPRNIDVPGASKFHKGLDYATPEGTPVEVAGGRFLTTFKDPGGGGIMSQYAFQKDGKDYEVLLLHGSDKNPVLSKGARTDGGSSMPTKMEVPEVKPAEMPEVKEAPAAEMFIPGALKQYPGIVARYQGQEVGGAAAPMKSPEPAFDIRNRDVSARAAFDPRFDKKP